MKKSALKKKRITNRSKMAIAATATMMAAPMIGIPVRGMAQLGEKDGSVVLSKNAAIKQPGTLTYLKFSDMAQKLPSTYSIAGIDGEHIVYKNSRNEIFYIDPATGDFKYVSAGVFQKYKDISSTRMVQSKIAGKAEPIKFNDAWIKDHKAGNVAILGEDAGGHIIMKNSVGETVYLSPLTGDFVPVNLNLHK